MQINLTFLTECHFTCNIGFMVLPLVLFFVRISDFTDRLSRNKMWCAADKHNYMCHTCARGFSDLNFLSINNISDFRKLTQISHIHKYRKFISIKEKR